MKSRNHDEDDDEQFEFNIEEGRRLRDEGIARALNNTPNRWKQNFISAVKTLAARMVPFTAEDIRDLCGDPPNPKSFGAMTNAAIKLGLMKKIGYTQSKRESSHAALLQVYIGLS